MITFVAGSGTASGQKKILKSLERRVTSSWAIEGVMPAQGGIQLVWNREVSYNAAVAWVKKAMEDFPDCQWRLDLAEGTPGRATAQAAPTPAPVAPAVEPTRATPAAAPAAVAPAVEPTRATPAVAPAEAAPAEELPPARQWILVKVLEMRLGTVVPSTFADYDAREVIGEGTFGVVSRAVNRASGQRVVIKRLKDANWEAFLRELSLLCGLHHPNLVEVVDAMAATGRDDFAVVLADGGQSLRAKVRSGWTGLSATRHVASSALSALVYLHSRYIVHTDIKPANMVVDSFDSNRIRIADLGSAIVAVPDYRSCWATDRIVKTGLQYGTLWYRAWEVLLGDGGFNFPVDLWSLGCVLAEVACGKVLFKQSTSIGCIMSIITTIGLPVGDELRYSQSLPLWSAQFPTVCGSSLDRRFGPILGDEGVQVLTGMLRHSPTARLSATSALSMPWPSQAPTGCIGQPDPPRSQIAPAASSQSVLSLVRRDGKSEFSGGRGPWSLLCGDLEAALLDWLRDQEHMAGTSGEFSDQGGKNRRVEEGCKIEIAGHMGDSAWRRGLTLNGLDASQPMFAKARQFSAAFKRVNADTLEELQKALRARLEKLDESSRGVNGNAFLTEDIHSWAADLGVLQLMKPTPRADPLHYDGGASFIHVGLTLWGKRKLVLKQTDGEDVTVQTHPGHIYVGCLCAAEHQVLHEEGSSDQDLLQHGTHGPLEVALMLRSRIFRGTRASTAARGPNPKLVWETANDCVQKSLQEGTWALPSLEDCKRVQP